MGGFDTESGGTEDERGRPRGPGIPGGGTGLDPSGGTGARPRAVGAGAGGAASGGNAPGGGVGGGSAGRGGKGIAETPDLAVPGDEPARAEGSGVRRHATFSTSVSSSSRLRTGCDESRSGHMASTGVCSSGSSSETLRSIATGFSGAFSTTGGLKLDGGGGGTAAGSDALPVGGGGGADRSVGGRGGGWLALAFTKSSNTSRLTSFALDGARESNTSKLSSPLLVTRLPSGLIR